MHPAAHTVERRLKSLQTHLELENPVLLDTVQSFRRLDRVAYGMGLLREDESFATRIPWWPLISVLGTFSAGKSSFINHFLGKPLQRTGNQAVDDRFTVICFSREATTHALPGVALDSDPRFPLYQISKDIDQVSAGEGARIDTYLQLKTNSSEKLRGKILIDSPGFDADAQRTATLRITNQIIDLSDLVLVLFDARHPEPGAMRDTLQHLVADTIHRPDSGKFLFILNQIDTAAREDNPEDVVAAWQRALGEEGLTAGRFYTIYNPDAGTTIEDPDKRARFEKKRDEDLAEIHGRMQEVEVERAYRIVNALEKTAADIQERLVPYLQSAISRWRKRVLRWDIILAVPLLAGVVGWLTAVFHYGTFPQVTDDPWLTYGPVGAILLLAVALHFLIRAGAAKRVAKEIAADTEQEERRGDLLGAFARNTRWWRPIFARSPVGWGKDARQRLDRVREDANIYIQTLNDRFTNPSGDGLGMDREQPAPPAVVSATG